MSISCASAQMLWLNGCLQGWLLNRQMCERYPPPSFTEMVWDFCRSPLCQTESQQISPIHHHQHFTGLWAQYCTLNRWNIRHVRKLNSTLISFHLYFMFYSLIFVTYVLGVDIPKKHHMLEKQILEMQTVWNEDPVSDKLYHYVSDWACLNSDLHKYVMTWIPPFKYSLYSAEKNRK